MPCWYFDKKELRNTPSLQDGIDFETELRYRREGARFIMDIGSKMDLGYNTMATGVVYFHRFYMFHSFRNFHRFVTACGCLFLAGKVEETPKKCKDIIKAAKGLVTDQKFTTFGEDPKEEVMTLERILLQTIKFDLQVEHPYHFIVKYAKCLKGDKTKLQKMVQMAWTFVNDSLCTTLCLQWEPEVIAVALMYLAGKLSKFEVVDWSGRTGKHLRWWDMFIDDVTMDLLEDICHQVLDLYSQPANPNPPDSPPLVKNRDGAGITLLPDPSIPPTLHTIPGVGVGGVKGVMLGGKVELKGVVVDGGGVPLPSKMVLDPLKGPPPLPPMEGGPPALFPGPFPPPSSAAAPPPLFAAAFPANPPPPPAQFFTTAPAALPPSRPPFFPPPNP